MREKWEHRQTGVRNAHRIAIVSGDIDFTPITRPLDDLQFVEQRHLSTAEIARLFRVPPWMVGATSGDSLTYSNTESQSLAFVTYSLRPWLVAIEQAITAEVDLCRGGLYVEFMLDALLRADSKTRADVYALALDPVKGWMSPRRGPPPRELGERLMYRPETGSVEQRTAPDLLAADTKKDPRTHSLRRREPRPRWLAGSHRSRCS